MNDVPRLRRLVDSLTETETELIFQSNRLDTKAAERADSRLRSLSEEYAFAASAVRKLRTHQERRLSLLLTGSARHE
jgi:hypothetical protein